MRERVVESKQFEAQVDTCEARVSWQRKRRRDQSLKLTIAEEGSDLDLGQVW